MKPLFAFGLCILCSAGLAAQAGAGRLGASRGIAVAPPSALGGHYGTIASSHPLGGVALPTFPGTGVRRRKSSASTVGYSPIFYVPNYYDTSYDNGQSGYSYAPPQGAAPATQPIIINQYFGSRGPDDHAADGPDAYAQQQAQSPEELSNPGDPMGVPQNYYLIAYRDHSMYSALAYWIEGETLHYVTTQNTHNQASLSLIDLDQTAKLNADRSVPFSIPGR